MVYVVVIVVNPVGQVAVYEVTTTVVTVLGLTLDPVVIDEGTSVTDIVPEVNVGRPNPDVVLLSAPVDRLPENKGVELVVTKILLVFEAVLEKVCLEPGILISDDGMFEEEPIVVEDLVEKTELDEVGLIEGVKECDVSVKTELEATGVLD